MLILIVLLDLCVELTTVDCIIQWHRQLPTAAATSQAQGGPRIGITARPEINAHGDRDTVILMMSALGL